MHESEAGKELLVRLDDNCKLLYNGYSERVEYKVAVAYHRDGCHHFGKGNTPKHDCECPVVFESRARNIRRPSLLEQLQAFAVNRDTDRNPKAERGAPRVKTPKCHAELAGYFAYDEIVTDIYSTVDRALEEVGRDRNWASMAVTTILQGLAYQVTHFVESRPDVARDLDKAARGWVDSARSTLMIKVSDSIFESVTCGNCGGALSTPWGNRGEADVRCVGSPAEPPCGHTYPMSEWIKLYEDHKRRVG